MSGRKPKKKIIRKAVFIPFVKLKPVRNKIRKHASLDVVASTLEKALCLGAHGDESAKEVEGYQFIEPGGFSQEFGLCRPCAVKLALRILELETL